jgi:hypothetical protein
MIVIVASEAIDFILPILEYVYRHTKIYCAITFDLCCAPSDLKKKPNR